MIDIAAHQSVDDQLIYRCSTYDGGFLDDQLWVLAMSTVQYLDKTRRNIGEMRNTAEDAILWHMICHGALDHSDEDKCWDSSTRAIRHSAIIGDQLWTLVDRERVSGLDACLLVNGHQRCSKRRVVRGEGKLWSVRGSEVG